jgi:uncharacterized UBP type Zn finger protein
MSHPNKICKHLEEFKLIPPKNRQCDRCVEVGDTWVHLRVCQTCGEVNCCDSSKNKHATKHYHKTEHTVIISAEAGERWAWCYEDRLFTEYKT